MPATGVAPQHLLDLERQPVHAFAHVGVAGGQPHPRPARKRDHRPTSARNAAPTVAGSTVPEIRTRPPRGSSISIDPGPGDVGGPDGATSSAGGGKAAGAIVTAAKPGAAGADAGRPATARSCLRQVKSWLVLTPCRRATPCTVPPAANVSPTSRRLSSSDQRRRARPWKISTRALRSLQAPV